MFEKYEMKFSGMGIVFLMLTLNHQIFATTTCPEIVRIEKGSKSTVSCTSDTTFVDVYWYRGPTSSTDPILLLENEQRGGTEYGNAHYDITLLGQMIIKDATLEQEATYTLVAYFLDGTSEQANVTVIITITPNPPCPTISSCEGCERCSLNISKSGSLGCNIYEARPRIQLHWNIESQEKIKFSLHQPIFEYNEGSDSWNTSVTLAYEATACDGSSVLQCVATHQDNLKNESVNTMYIFTDACSQDISLDKQGPSAGLVIFVMLIIVVVISLGVGLFLCYQRKKKIAKREEKQQSERNQGTVSPLLPTTEQTKVQEEGEENETAVSQIDEKKEDPEELEKRKKEMEKKKKESLISGLKQHYQTFCDKISLPEDHAISASSLYTHFQCSVTTQEGETHQCSSEELFRIDWIEKANSVRLFGKCGYGKTTFAHNLVRQWVQEDENTNILIYLDMNNVNKEDRFFKSVKDVLSDESDITAADVKNIVLKNDCLLLLDRCDAMTMVAKQDDVAEYSKRSQNSGNVLPSTNEFVEDDEDDFKIKDIYELSINDKYQTLRLWIMTRETIQLKSSYPRPFVTVTLIGFSTEQTNEFVEKFCKNYNECYSIPEGEAHYRQKLTNSTTKFPRNENLQQIELDTVATKMETQVKQIVGKKEILYEFCKNPFYLTSIAYIVAKSVANKNVSKENTLNCEKVQSAEMKLTTMVSKLIELLELKCFKGLSESDSNDGISKMKEKLSKLALTRTTQYHCQKYDEWVKALGRESMDLAMSVNLIQENIDANIIQFSYRTFESYFAASYFPTKEENSGSLSVLMMDDRDNKTEIIFQFLCGLNSSLVQKVLEHFIENKKFNSFMDCLYEVTDFNVLKLFRSSLEASKKELEMTISHRNCYHRDALRKFCNFCQEWEVEIQALTLEGNFPVSFLKSLKLPYVKQLEIKSVDLNAADFNDVIEWLITIQNIPGLCRFTDCLVPMELFAESWKHVKDLTKKSCKIERVDNNVTSKPDPSKRQWKSKR